MEAPKSDSFKNSRDEMLKAVQQFAKEGGALLDTPGLDEKTINALRSFIEGFIIKYETVLEENTRLRFGQGTNHPSDEAKYNVLQQFEKEQGTLVQVVADAQEALRVMESKYRSAEGTITRIKQERDEAKSMFEQRVIDIDLQYAANTELVRLNRRYQSERDDAEEKLDKTEGMLKVALAKIETLLNQRPTTIYNQYTPPANLGRDTRGDL